MSRRREKQRDRIRVRMTLHTLSLVAIVLAMAYSGAVQTNGAAYLLAFLTAALGAMSYVHARANLRGLEIVPGALPPIQAGQPGTLPLTVRAASGLSPCGLELLVVGARKATLLERIQSGNVERVTLSTPPQQEGVQQRMKLLVRSVYPLGMFAAERQIEIECAQRVHPRPAGDLPLPEPDPALRQEALAFAGAAAQIAGGGDDFAGLREWQVGDSPRHIDWRAVARGRPLMVKQWSGSAPDAVRLDWESLDMPPQERTEQVAQWVEMCESRGLPYALRLPQCEVPVGLGPAHARRCLDALADLSVRSGTQMDKSDRKQPRIPASHERSAHLPGKPLAMLCVGLALAVAPLWPIIAPTSLILLVLCFLWRWFGRGRPVGVWAPPLLALIGVAGVIAHDDTLWATEAGIAVLVVLQGCKLIEARSPHDFQVLAMIGWFICLCGLLAEQSLERSLFSIGLFVYIAVCMIRFRRITPGLKVPVRVAGTLLLQALPIAVVLFVVFPREGMDALARRLSLGQATVTGVPTELDPGTIASVVNSDASAFRVKFPGSEPPPNQQRYWRCVVLWDCGGLNWRRGMPLLTQPGPAYAAKPGDVRQEIDLEAHGQFWLPALDRPQRGRGENGMLLPMYDETLQSPDVVRRPQRFQVVSRPTLEAEPLPPGHRQAALKEPEKVSERLRDVARQWRAGARSDVEIVQAGLLYLRNQRFSYTLDPGKFTGPNAFEDFWFERKVGFCGHFSASFATMMRLAGVPSRVVMGYLGGTWNDRGGYLLVRQSDAHAWTEVWLEQSGWTRIDPTAVLVPSRLNLDLQGSLLGDEEEANRQRNSVWWRSYHAAQMFWDNVSYEWNTRVIQFDEESQMEWMAYFGLSRMSPAKRGLMMLAICGGAIVLGLVALMLWLRRPARHRDPWARAWQRLCRQLVRLGAPERQESEGPLAYAERVGTNVPALSAEVQRLAGIYARARYGEEKGSLKMFYREARRLGR